MTQQTDAADWQARLVAGAGQLGLELRAAQIEQLWQLAGMLRERNRVMNLTSVDSLDGILTVHMFDSLAVVPHLGAARQIVDIGTGGGFPGLPLAIACPEREFLLIDGTQKKIRFVQEVVATLRLANARAEAVRAEQLRPVARFDAAVVRAVGSLRSIIEVAAKLVDAMDGRILALKGKRPDNELANLPVGWRADAIPLAVPGLDAERCLVVLTHQSRQRR
ncbi:MAG TPA: 16S rRNA (guanine(527)-N(7))-methyltransferase RsmG [Steroidobacteraceae bacterium]|nr:16S rRNA (guanine(527)-N(7))-methyltransferase RsmG [Steroidobacteraceae bacterium]HRX87894.1 16S rRNA (guanine(527)-N(7))-methyltransferase RsmG [Steroidobacteraceae bacterium]